MEHTRYIAPRLGIITILCLLLGMIVIAARWDNGNLQAAEIGFHNTAHFATVGVLYGMIGGTCWILTMVRNLVVRSTLRIVVALAGTYFELRLLGVTGWDTELLLRHIINFGGLMISQTTIFLLLRIPDWRWGPEMAVKPQQPRWSIGGILILTLFVAILLALAVRYKTRIDAIGYWLVLFGICILIPLSSAASVASLLARSRPRRLLAAVTAVLLAAVGSLLIGLAEQWLRSRGDIQWQIAAANYWMIVSSSMGTMAVLSFSGRLGEVTHPKTDIGEQDS